MLTALTPVPAARRTHYPLDQQSQQTAREHPVHVRERLPCRRGCQRLPAQGGTAESPDTAHLPCPSRPAPHAAAAHPRPRLADRQFLGQEEDPLGSIHLCMQCGLSLEHTFRLFKQVLGWTAPKIRSPEAADRWTWLIIACYSQLRLARPLAADIRLPWQRPCPPGRLTPARVRRDFRNIRATAGCPAGAPKPGKPGPGRPPGSTNRRPAPRHDVGKTTKRELTLKARGGPNAQVKRQAKPGVPCLVRARLALAAACSPGWSRSGTAGFACRGYRIRAECHPGTSG